MDNMKSFSCFIIGDGLLAIACSEYLLRQGHEILGIVTSCQDIIDWCKANNIAHIKEEHMKKLKKNKFDYLFSIVYLKVLPKEIICLPNKMAINYHDAILPQYAGINATSWAIIQGEKKHGITWHVMEEKADTGDILIQRETEIANNETSLSLNMKCFQLGLQGFKELVEKLTNGQISPTSQALSQRTYFKKKKKPDGGGIIDFSKSLKLIRNYILGLQFGKYDNTLATPKIMIRGNVFAISDFEIKEGEVKFENGEGEIKKGVLSVQAKDGIIQFNKLTDLYGRYVSIDDLEEQYGSLIQLSLTKEKKEQLTMELKIISMYEEYWVKKMECIFEHYYNIASNIKEEIKEEPIPYELQRVSFFEKIMLILQDAVYKELGISYFVLGFVPKRDNSVLKECQLCQDYVPFELKYGKNDTLDERINQIREERKNIEEKVSFAKDIFIRYVRLYGMQFIPSVIISHSEDTRNDEQAALVIKFNEENKACEFIYNQNKDQSGKVNDILIRLEELSEYYLSYKINVRKNEKNKFQSIYELFMIQVEKSRDDNVAVIYKNEQITYKKLSKQIDILSAVLHKNGVQKGTNIGVLLRRSSKLVISFLAIMKLGGVYIPMDPIYPKERLEFMAEDAEIEYLLCEQIETTSAINGNFKVISIDNIEEKEEYEQEYNTEIIPRDPVYIIYTSGSTGNPKGVVVNHGGLSNCLLSMEKVPGFSPKDKLLALTTVCFDISGLELYLPLICGGTTEILQDNIAIDGRLLKEKMESSKATVIQATPSTWNMVLMAGWNSKLNIKIFCGGEKLSNNLSRKLLGLCDELWNMYGPTETTIWSMVKRIVDSDNVSIGNAIDNTQLYILNNEFKPTNENAGELYIGGLGVANGYYNKENITKEKFVINPFQTTEQIYRTGDLVQTSSNGDVYYLGRVDNQIKYHGYRIELEEIEHIMLEKMKIEKVVVVIRTDEKKEDYLCAFIKDSNNRLKNLNFQKLSEFLPQYMIPTQIYLVNDFPLTENNKINRRFLQLKAIDEILNKFGAANHIAISEQSVNHHVGLNYVGTELIIKNIWEHVLNTKVLSKDTPFFEAGGNSLLLNHLRNELETAFSKEIDIVDLLSCNTISKMYNLIEPEENEVDKEKKDDLNIAMKRKMFLERARR
ncbi:amino acid adenylation domain-containing protein [Anaerocolumna sp. AGMB13025]|uniref:amino acid adenylation domain-containing protein n=1 Tax=Anaerocolumna sp. AGMB13025 TaxID=3039116 RepID=UPI00241E1D5D|nr:amino acid adenylation domain-containing protein [Anaerocolumna sp. AGMB13025]WFR57112.1 amino acid adenylation domain-containing protein [Anaerocolumna sp. AGMB13025]